MTQTKTNSSSSQYSRSELLAIMQQCEYDLAQFNHWTQAHQRDHLNITPATPTLKLKLVELLSRLLFFASPSSAIYSAVLLLEPFDWVGKQSILILAQLKLWWLRLFGLQVIAIAGSYAKTSTKHLMNHAIGSFVPTLVTPKSYNTPLGIAQVILGQLTAKHRVLVVEFGEYQPRDIEYLTHFVKPDYAVITPIGRQHLAVMGSLKNIVQTFQPLLDFFGSEVSKILIADHNVEFFASHPRQYQYYGSNPGSAWSVHNCSVSRAGTEGEFGCHLHLDQKHLSLPFFLPLLGSQFAINSLPSLWLAQQLGLDLSALVKKLRTVPYITRRHQPTFAEHNVLILDNSYNTNPDSVVESLKLLNQLEPTRRFIVTLGFTELGTASAQIHRHFGTQLAHQVDYVGLIESPWAEDIQAGWAAAGGRPNQLVVGKTQDEAFQLLQVHVIPGSVILFEGGYREVYV